jgi:hypothetical protein
MILSRFSPLHLAAITATPKEPNIILVITSAVLGLFSQRGLVLEMLPLAIFLIVLGIYGAITSQKYYERHQFHIERTRAWRKRLEELTPKSQINKLREEANAKHSKKFKQLEKIHLHSLWLFLHVTITLMGIILSSIILINYYL